MEFTTKGLPWAIGADVTDCTTAAEVISKAELDFQVEKCQLMAKMPFTINGNNELNNDNGDFAFEGSLFRNINNRFATYRTDKNIALGVVKQDYRIVQNSDAFDFFNEAIGEDKAVWQNAGCLNDGKKVFVTAKLPIQTTVGGNDPIDNYLVFSNSHDGSSAIDVMFTPIRVFCTNCLAAGRNSANAHIRIRHTESAKEKLEKGARILKIACEQAQSAEMIYNSLYAMKMNSSQIIEYLAKFVFTEKELFDIHNYDAKAGLYLAIENDNALKEQAQLSTRKLNKFAKLWDYYRKGIAQEEIKGTAWGAYNAITGYLTNVHNLEGEKRFESLMNGSGQATIYKSLESALQLAEAV